MQKQVQEPHASLPTRRTIQNALAQAMGIRAAIELWQITCEKCELQPTAALTEPSDILRVCDYLETCGGLAAVVGKSASVQVNFVLKLQRERLSKAAALQAPSATDVQALRDERNARSNEILRLNALDPDLHQLLQPILERAASAVRLPVAAVNVLTEDVQHIVASLGIDEATRGVGGMPRDWSFCQYVVEDEAALVVENTSKSKRVRDLPSVTAYGVGSYIGVPLRTKNHQTLGALCATGESRGKFSAHEVQQMHALSAEIVSLLEERAKSKN